MKKRVLIVDDHLIFQQALCLVLEHQMGLTVAANAATGTEALAHAERDTFDLILLDVHLPDVEGIEISRRILQLRPEAKIIVLSAEADPRRVDEALLAGVLGYVLKTNAITELRHAIEAVEAGRRYLSPEANAALLGSYQHLREASISTVSLSGREREVVKLIATGQRTKDIAATLGIGMKSVETYRNRTMQKLGKYSIAELTRYALQEGLA